MRKIKKFVNPVHISQIYSRGLEYTMLNSKNEMLLPWVFCKDFLSDLVWASIHKKKASIYGIEYNGVDSPMPMKGARIGLRNSDISAEDFTKGVKNSVRLVNDFFALTGKFPNMKIAGTEKFHIEKQVYKDGRYQKVENDSEIVVVKVPHKFLSAPPLMSLLTMLLRCGIYYGEKSSEPLDYLKKMVFDKWDNIEPNDKQYTKKSWKFIYGLTYKGVRSFIRFTPRDNWPTSATINKIHEKTGIRSYAGYMKRNEKFHISVVKEFSRNAKSF